MCKRVRHRSIWPVLALAGVAVLIAGRVQADMPRVGACASDGLLADAASGFAAGAMAFISVLGVGGLFIVLHQRRK